MNAVSEQVREVDLASIGDRGYHFWLKSDIPHNHPEDQRGGSIFPCPLCNQDVWQELTEPEASHAWFSCECLTAAFPTKTDRGSRPANSNEWKHLILALRCEEISA
jgi:hypothetical protein